jgi:eukaryotic-like serine/threonine-protein kinase
MSDAVATRPGSTPAIEVGSTGSVERIGDYVVQGLLGQGASGHVYRALHPQLERAVALKVIELPSGPADRRAVGLRVLREGRALARLRHANVVTVYEVGEVEGRAFLAMELIEGETLREWAARDHSMAERLAVLAAAARGLAAVHDVELVHRDVKPDNFLVAEDGRVAIGDFGLARDFGGDDAVHELAVHDSMATPLVGTLPYMAPEVLAGGSATFASDQYSFCMMAYECLYGRRPFMGATPTALREAIAAQSFPSDVDPRLPARLHALLRRGLAADPASRHPSMSSIVDGLAPPSRSRRWIVAAGLAGVLGIGVAAWLGLRAEPDTCERLARWDGTWDAPRRAAIARAFAATGTPYAAQTAAQVDATLEQYTSAWSVRARELCHVSDAPARAHERACLERRRGDVAQLVRAFTSANPALVAIAPRLTLGLRPWSHCQLEPGATVPPTVASSQITKLQNELAAASLAHRTGDLATAERGVRSIIERVRDLDVALLTEARLVLASVLTESMREPADEDAYFEAATGAEAAGLHGLAAEAWLALAGIARDRPDRTPHQWLALAEIAVRRAGNRPEHVSALSAQRAMQAVDDGEFAAAMDLQRRAAKQLELAALGPDDLRVVNSNYRLGLSLGMQRHYDQAEPLLRAVVEARGRLLSRSHPDTLDAEEALGICLHRLGRAEEAVPLLTNVLRMRERELGPDVPGLARPLDNLAGALHSLGRNDEAVALLRRSIALRETTEDDVRLARPLVNLGTVLVAMQRPEEAIAPLRRGRDLFVAASRDGAALYAQIRLANALTDAGRPREALDELVHPSSKPLSEHEGAWLVARGRALLALRDRAAGAVLDRAANHPDRERWPSEVEDQLSRALDRLATSR